MVVIVVLTAEEMAMNHAYSIIVVALTSLFSMITCQSLISQRYSSAKAADGSPLCSTEQPSKVVAMSAGLLRCGKECNECTTCIVYQMNEDKKQCQLFNYSPMNYTKVNQCKAYYVASDVNMRNARITNRTCSFPFTSNGTLYFSCVSSIPSLCDAWCLNMNAQRLTCSKDEYAYSAQNSTVNVTIPVSNGVVTLKSIHQWLIIMSRIDNNFPLRQTYSAYQAGFGNLTSNFWLGLTRVYYITNSAVNGGHTYRLRFELQSAGNSKWYSEEYKSFYLESSATNFKLRVASSATGDAGDSVNANAPSNGGQFLATGIIGFCVDSLGPWWYASAGLCSACPLFGSSGGYWSSVGNLKVSRMMIRLEQ